MIGVRIGVRALHLLAGIPLNLALPKARAILDLERFMPFAMKQCFQNSL